MMGVATVQMTLEGHRYYDSTCRYCGKKFNRKYHTEHIFRCENILAFYINLI